MASKVTAVGLDIGSQKTMIVADDGEIVRTDTGSISRPTMVSFAGKKRLFGEEALAQASSESTIALLNLLTGRSVAEISALNSFNGRKLQLTDDEAGRTSIEVNFNDKVEKFPVTSLLGMFVAHLSEQIDRSASPTATYCLVLPPNFTKTTERAYREACVIGGIEESRLFTADAADCLVAAYARKVDGLGGPEQINLLGKTVLLLDVGHVQSTAVVVQYPQDAPAGQGPIKLAVQHDAELGAYHFDLRLFDHFNDICQKKHGSKAEMTSRRGNRLLSGCERIRKLLSQLNESQVTIENLVDSGDVHFSLKRDDMANLCSDLLTRLRSLMEAALAQAGSEAQIHAVEVVGGGVRMPVIQYMLLQQVLRDDKMTLGAKLDDGSLAMGAALLYKKSLAAAAVSPVPEAESTEMEISETSSTVGFSAEELVTLRSQELALQTQDAAVRAIQDATNRLESFLLEMRNAPRQKSGDLIDRAALTAVLDEHETWLWDHSESATLAELEAQESTLRASVQTICAAFFAATEAEKQRVEQALQEEAARAAAERAANGEDEDGDDHDTRKLRKPDRMRMVVKNKEEGTELFKGGNFRPAAARYHKALTHSSKFFDLTKEDEEEVKAIQVTLYCNLASCYIKLENWDQVLRNCEEALKLDPKCVKALFRRGSYHEAKKDWDQALVDYRTCAEINDSEDKLVTKASDRVKKEIAKLKDKEKKMWGKAFS